MLDGSGRKRYSSVVRAIPLPNLIRLAFALAVPLFFSGCILPGDSASRDVKLSDAMRASANNDRHDLGGDSSRNNSTDVDVRAAGDPAGRRDDRSRDRRAGEENRPARQKKTCEKNGGAARARGNHRRICFHRVAGLVGARAGGGGGG